MFPFKVGFAEYLASLFAETAYCTGMVLMPHVQFLFFVLFFFVLRGGGGIHLTIALQ